MDVKSGIRLTIICAVVTPCLLAGAWFCGFRMNPNAAWLDPSSWHFHLERRATTRFQMVRASQRRGPFDFRRGSFEAPAPDWQEHEVDSMTAENFLAGVVKSQSLQVRWRISESGAIHRLKDMIDVKLEKGADIVSVTVRSDSAAEAAELANAVREAYVADRLELQRNWISRLIQGNDSRIAAQVAEVEKARLQLMGVAEKYGIPLSPPAADGARQNLSQEARLEYLSAKFKYESQSEILKQAREMYARFSAEPGLIQNPVVVLEEARPSGR